MRNEVADEMRGFVRRMIDKVESDGAWWRAEARALAGRRERGR
jgi:hypothetical protein